LLVCFDASFVICPAAFRQQCSKRNYAVNERPAIILNGGTEVKANRKTKGTRIDLHEGTKVYVKKKVEVAGRYSLL
jgi:hypothetical protein